MSAQPPSATTSGSPADVSRDEAFETSRLVVELLHAAQASRRSPATQEHGTAESASATGNADPGVGSPPLEAAPSDHVIRASIHLYQHGERTVGQLADGLGISRGWASRVADELVARGHASREADPSDRRVVRLRLTDQSLAEIERAYRWRGDVVASALASHAPAERAAIRQFLRDVAAGLGERSAPGG